MHGWPLLVHYCDTCHYNTPLSYSPNVWKEEHSCTHCGTKSPGADVAGHSAAEMNQSQHDELAQLFAQNMQLSQQAAQQQALQQQQAQQMHSQAEVIHSINHASEKQQGGEQPITYISSHYTGTAHVRPTETVSEPSRSPPPPYNDSLMPEAMADLLRHHAIEPAALLPNQIHLFLNADDEQRSRLLELWRIAPPSYPLADHTNGTWVSTSVQREEDLARSRYLRQQQSAFNAHEESLLDTHVMTNDHESGAMSPIREMGEPAWPPAARMRAASIAASKTNREAEEYIVNGYAADRQAKSIDPVYAAAAGCWQAPSYAEAVQVEQQRRAMEDQYGMLEQIRNHADWERMNQQAASAAFGRGGGGGGDDDMEL